jgi:hypothetical protein
MAGLNFLMLKESAALRRLIYAVHICVLVIGRGQIVYMELRAGLVE